MSELSAPELEVRSFIKLRCLCDHLLLPSCNFQVRSCNCDHRRFQQNQLRGCVIRKALTAAESSAWPVSRLRLTSCANCRSEQEHFSRIRSSLLITRQALSGQRSTAVCHGQAFTTRPLALDQIWTEWSGIGRSSKFNSITTSMMRNCCIVSLRPCHLNVSPIGRHDLWGQRRAVRGGYLQKKHAIVPVPKANLGSAFVSKDPSALSHRSRWKSSNPDAKRHRSLRTASTSGPRQARHR